jgi:hypothetical protein
LACEVPDRRSDRVRTAEIPPQKVVGIEYTVKYFTTRGEVRVGLFYTDEPVVGEFSRLFYDFDTERVRDIAQSYSARRVMLQDIVMVGIVVSFRRGCSKHGVVG